jgi:7-carboxy-7-deazaguanine synthase
LVERLNGIQEVGGSIPPGSTKAVASVSYAVKEIYLTLQGEGTHAGRAAVFCRFAGCNLWTGREADRADAVCGFCDTDFVGTDGPGGGRFASAAALAEAVLAQWGGGKAERFVVLTGGEPLLQADPTLIDALHAHGFSIAVETNGTIAAPVGLDWICVSPKGTAALVQQAGDELKLAYPQGGIDPAAYADLAFTSFRLQPIDGPAQAENTQAAIAYCLAHPQWRLSVQTHKFLGIA